MTNVSLIRRGALVALLIAIGFAWSPGLAARTGSDADGAVKVTVNYTGKGEVDDSHRLWVWLFDSPNIGAGSMPIAETSIDKNGGVAAFDGITAPQVWIAVAYDARGGFTGMAPPPSGSPASTYGIASGAPEAVTPGDKGEVTFTFDDSFKMP
jgi:hypothetical protein